MPLIFKAGVPITALVYTDSAAADCALRDIAIRLMEQGYRLAGLVQINTPRPGRSRCDMLLEELSSGEHLGISQDRGPQARGCTLDLGQLLTAMETVRAALASKPDLVILNKFGKAEAEGRGLRPLIAETIEAGLPLLIGVPWRNIESWRLFAGPFSHEVLPDAISNASIRTLFADEGGQVSLELQETLTVPASQSLS